MENPRIQELAGLLGRSAGSVSMKLSNLARLDPALQARGIKGLPHGAKGEGEVWDEFENEPEALVLESQRILAGLRKTTLEQVSGVEVSDLPPEGADREAIVRIRVNQNFFRRRVLSMYQYRCCITGCASEPLLVASHIVPWAEDRHNRLNVRNGLCLNALHDRAFDRKLMWIDGELRVRFSNTLARENSDQAVEWLTRFEGKRLALPKGFTPDPELLKRHASASSGEK